MLPPSLSDVQSQVTSATLLHFLSTVMKTPTAIWSGHLSHSLRGWDVGRAAREPLPLSQHPGAGVKK